MRRGEQGANLVEAALVIPLLILILAGIVDLGRTFYNYISIANAAREGARAGARLSCYPGSTTVDAAQRATYRQTIVDSVFNELTGTNIDTAALQFTLSPDPQVTNTCPKGAQKVVVTLSYPEDMILTSIIGASTINLTATASMSRMGETGK
jgi:Flp pilus assembly protein TadG